ncbi:hypothetical protein C5167_028164 [Papaver somniferum]|nr:hypothetical protein C5167_028164 [Papaver somniferum]
MVSKLKVKRLEEELSRGRQEKTESANDLDVLGTDKSGRKRARKFQDSDEVSVKEVFKRLYSDLKCSGLITQVGEVKEEKLVKATKKDGPVLDQYLPEGYKTKYHVLEHGGEIYDAMWKQTNNFYVIQALESDNGGDFIVFTRWGRVGARGSNKFQGFTDRDDAIQDFKQRFYDKTKNLWSARNNFVCHSKFYTWFEMDSKEPRNKSVGYKALKSISEAITANLDTEELARLSGAFYTVIHHHFAFKNMSEFIIDTPQKLKSKIEMVEALGEIELATKLLNDNDDMKGYPLYSLYNRLQCNLHAIEADSKDYTLIEKYLKNTHANVHSDYTVDIVQLFRISRKCEEESFRKFSNAQNRMLLWHGSRLTIWTGILSQGLRIAPPEAPLSGYMFGKGVALGEMAELPYGNHNADQLPTGKLSTKGVGSTAPDPSELETLEDGIVVPLGKTKKQPDLKGDLLHNEYIVYNVDQIRMRYLIHVQFTYK